MQVNVRKEEICYLDSFPDGVKEFNKIVELLTATRTVTGLTKKKFEMLSQQSTDIEAIGKQVGDKLAQFKSSVEIQSQLLAKYCTYTI